MQNICRYNNTHTEGSATTPNNDLWATIHIQYVTGYIETMKGVRMKF